MEAAPRSRTAPRTRRGVALLESLIAAVVVGVVLMAMINLFWVTYSMTQRAGSTSMAYTVGRYALENVRSQGFYNAAEGATTTYYAIDGSGPHTTQGADRYKVVVTITSDKFQTLNGVTTPADDALRAVKAVVTDLATSATFYTAGTNLVRAGV